MANLYGREVSKVQLHETCHVTNLGSVATTVSSDLGGKQGATELTLTEIGVHVKGVGPQGGKFEFVLPLAACKMIQLAAE